MNLNDFIFTSYCFNNSQSGDYKSQQDRLKQSILDIYPTANLHFESEPEHIGKPKFQQSLYGFKVRLVEECLAKGFKKIIFFDTSICLNDTVDYWFNLTKELGVLCAVDRQTLNNVTSNNCLKYLNLKRDEVANVNLVGGSIYVFDFDTQLCNNIFNMWAELESKGLFGQQEDLSNGKLEGHRMDETCMALSLALHEQKPLGHDIFRYAYVKPGDPEKLYTMGDGEYKPVCIKRHFK